MDGGTGAACQDSEKLAAERDEWKRTKLALEEELQTWQEIASARQACERLEDEKNEAARVFRFR